MIDPEHPVLYDKTIRDILGDEVLGRTIVELTQHDKDEYVDTGETYIEVCLDNGLVLQLVCGRLRVLRPNGDDSTIGTKSDLGDGDDAEDSVE